MLQLKNNICENHPKSRKIKGMGKFLTILSFIAFGLLNTGSSASAQGSGFVMFSSAATGAASTAPAASACDPDYYQSLESRAWLEAQREITQNQNIITRPDSVLAYSCFDRLAASLTQESPALLSGEISSDRPGAVPNPTNLPTTIDATAIGPLRAYYDTNFPSEDGYEFEITSTQTDDYDCAQMAQLWEQARCAEATGGDNSFFTFDNYASGGASVSSGGSAGASSSNGTACPDPGWGDNLAASGSSGSDGTPWQEDEAETSFDEFNPDNCSQQQPVAVGLTNNVTGQPVYKCLAPGCVAQVSGNGSARCVSAF